MTALPNKFAAATRGVRRDDAGAIVPFLPGAPKARWSRHAKVDADHRQLPIHLSLRDVIPSPEIYKAMKDRVPRAAQLFDAFHAGEIVGREAAIKADVEYRDALASWVIDFHKTPAARGAYRSDADSVWLQSETVHWMTRVLTARYNEATIFNVIPTEVLGTGLTTYMQIAEDETDEVAVIGDTFEPMGAPVSSAVRGEIARKLLFYKYSAEWTDRDLEIEAEVRANGRGPAYSLIDRKTAAAQRAMDTQRAWIAAYGIYAEQGLPGLLYGSPPADAAEEVEFAGPDPEANVNALLALVAEQEVAVNFRQDRVADTLALDPATFRHLGRQYWSDGVTTFATTALESFMQRAPGIRRIVIADEFRNQGAAAQAKLLPKFGGDAVMAARMTGGIRKEGEQRSVAMAYRDDADVFAHVVGRQLETREFPANYTRHSKVLRESSGGVIFFEPLGAAMIYRPVDGDPDLAP